MIPIGSIFNLSMLISSKVTPHVVDYLFWDWCSYSYRGNVKQIKALFAECPMIRKNLMSDNFFQCHQSRIDENGCSFYRDFFYDDNSLLRYLDWTRWYDEYVKLSDDLVNIYSLNEFWYKNREIFFCGFKISKNYVRGFDLIWAWYAIKQKGLSVLSDDDKEVVLANLYEKYIYASYVYYLAVLWDLLYRIGKEDQDLFCSIFHDDIPDDAFGFLKVFWIQDSDVFPGTLEEMENIVSKDGGLSLMEFLYFSKEQLAYAIKNFIEAN